MTTGKPLPRVVVSRCLGFACCRYDGRCKPSPEVTELNGLVELVTVCPEVDIGMGVPRPPINLHKEGDAVRVKQESTGVDWTERLESYSRAFIAEHGCPDAFILKSRSPSCGLETTPLRNGKEVIGLTSGVFAAFAKEHCKSSVFVDEEQLRRMGVQGFLRLLEP